MGERNHEQFVIITLFIIILTEIYSLKIVVNFYRQPSFLANQRSEQYFSLVNKIIRAIRISNDVFTSVRM